MPDGSEDFLIISLPKSGNKYSSYRSRGQMRFQVDELENLLVEIRDIILCILNGSKSGRLVGERTKMG